MPQALRFVPPESVVIGWDFSTGGVKCLAFDLNGKTVAEVRLKTDLWKGYPSQEELSELNIMQLEGQARATVRGMVALLREKGRLGDWIAGGISATHHTAGRLDANHNPLRRAICWDDHTLAHYHAIGLARLGEGKVQKLIGGPWAIRYSLSHLVKDEDEDYFEPEDWRRTRRILLHGPLAAGYLTGNFDVASISSAASTGIMDLVRCRWAWGMLEALEQPAHRALVKKHLPQIVPQDEPIGPLAANVALEAGMSLDHRPLVFPTSDDQAAGLVGGGAVDAGHMAVILGNSAVVNSSSNERPGEGSNLDVMRLNWGPYLWMRCYHNGAQSVDHVVGKNPDWEELEVLGGKAPVGCDRTWVMPFLKPEPSLGISKAKFAWSPKASEEIGVRFRASLEALAYLIALGVREHEKSGQRITRISVSGGIARSTLMCRILATVLGRRLERLKSAEGPALGAAVTALAAYESYRRKQNGVAEPYLVSDAVGVLVTYRKAVEPVPEWAEAYAQGLAKFEERLRKFV